MHLLFFFFIKHKHTVIQCQWLQAVQKLIMHKGMCYKHDTYTMPYQPHLLLHNRQTKCARYTRLPAGMVPHRYAPGLLCPAPPWLKQCLSIFALVFPSSPKFNSIFTDIEKEHRWGYGIHPSASMCFCPTIMHDISETMSDHFETWHDDGHCYRAGLKSLDLDLHWRSKLS